jgi:hypothetical protein
VLERSAMSTPRKTHGIYKSGADIYVFGGRANGKMNLASCERFSTLTETWADCPSMPVLLRYVSVARKDEFLYISGVFSKSDKLIVFNTQAKSFNQYPIKVKRDTIYKIVITNPGILLFGGGEMYNVEEREYQGTSNMICNNSWSSGPTIYHDEYAFFVDSTKGEERVIKINIRENTSEPTLEILS